MGRFSALRCLSGQAAGKAAGPVVCNSADWGSRTCLDLFGEQGSALRGTLLDPDEHKYVQP